MASFPPGNFDGDVTVPVIVESFGEEAGSALSRCLYLCIAQSVPSIGASIAFNGNERMPFLLLGLTGVIYSPPGHEAFDTPQKIDGLFATLDGEAGLSVEFNDLWLPREVFSEYEAAPGAVYRLSLRSFVRAYSFREGRITAEELMAPWDWELNHSLLETKSFALWQEGVAAMVRESFPKASELRLGSDDDEWPDPGATAIRPPDGPPSGGSDPKLMPEQALVETNYSVSQTQHYRSYGA